MRYEGDPDRLCGWASCPGRHGDTGGICGHALPLSAFERSMRQPAAPAPFYRERALYLFAFQLIAFWLSRNFAKQSLSNVKYFAIHI